MQHCFCQAAETDVQLLQLNLSRCMCCMQTTMCDAKGQSDLQLHMLSSLTGKCNIVMYSSIKAGVLQGTIGDAQFAGINRKLETIANAATAVPISCPSLSPVGSVRVYTSRSSTPTSTFHGAVKMLDSERGGSRFWRQPDGSMFAGISVASNLVSPEDTWNCIDGLITCVVTFPPARITAAPLSLAAQ